MTTLELPCATCARFDRDSGTPRCEAFPLRIPDEILLRGNDHTQPFPGDHGLQWTVAADAPVDVRRANRPFPSRAS
jgi:hypothetical protein